MNALAALWSATWWAIEVALVVAIPLAVARLGQRAVGRFTPGGFFEVPAVFGGARLLGLLAALFLLSARADVFDLRRVFGAYSPWNLTTWQFLATAADPFWTLDALVTKLAGQGAGSVSGGLGALTLLCLAGVLALPFAFWRGAASWRALLGAVSVALLTAYVTIYGIALLFWLLFLLNFWMLAVLLAILQWYRSRNH